MSKGSDFDKLSQARLAITYIGGVARIFQKGVTLCLSEDAQLIVMLFSPLVVGCLLKKKTKKRGEVHRPPRTTP